jgi:quercetin dioxygenase-like cupin family protein
MMYFHSCDARNIVARSFNLVSALTVHCDLRLLLQLGRNSHEKIAADGNRGLIALSIPAMAQNTEVRVMPDTLIWKDNPAFPKGVQIATLVGDPTKAGEVVVLRIKFPPNFQMPPHTHPYSEVVTVISGDVGSSHGEKFEKKGDLLKPGSLWVYPAKHAHYAWTGSEEGILQVQFTGPGGIDYINPADDPRKQ